MRKKRFITALLCAVLCLAFLPVFAIAQPDSADNEFPEGKYTMLSQLEGKRLGVRPASAQEKFVHETFENPQIQYYQSFADMAVALTQGKLDGFSTTSVVAASILKKYDGLTLVGETLAYSPIYFALGKSSEGQQIKAELDEYILQIDASGELSTIKQRWYDGDYSGYALGYDTLPDINGTILVATTAQAEPYSFYYNNIVTGIDLEIISGFCKACGYAMKLEIIETAGMLAGLESEKYQIAAGSLAKTEEREQHVSFSIAYENVPIVMVVQAKQGATIPATGWLKTLQNRIRQNLLEENRWQMFLSGIGVTLILSVTAVLFGTLLGFALCMGQLTSVKGIQHCTRIFLRFIQGIPTVLLLMLLYYVVFSKANLSGITVAAIGFTLYFAVYAADIFASGIRAVDVGQSEAAQVLGLGKLQGFWKVILPQAVNYTLPVYRNQVVTIIKATSVAGYIAVQDITKVSDIIRSRTFDAFFPLLISAIAYFVIAYLAGVLIGLLGRSSDPARRKPNLRGIDTQNQRPQSQSAARSAGGSDCVLRVEHLSKKYESAEPLLDLNMEVFRGESVCIIGPSGTGKSTLLRCICGLEHSSGGSIHLQSDGGIGMVFQSFNLFPHLTLIENLMLAPMSVHHVSRQQAYDEGMRLLTAVGLEDKRLSYPAALSGGQKQRAAIARALAMQPEVLLFDEPTSALDPTMVGEVIELLHSLHRDGITIVTVTHEMKVAKNAATRVIFLADGAICEEGTPVQIFEHAQKAQTMEFLQEQRQLEIQIVMEELSIEQLMKQMESFAHRYYLSARTAYHMQLCVEELLMNGFQPMGTKSISMQLSLTVNDTVNLRFRYTSTQNVMEGMDALSRKMVVSTCRPPEFSFSGDEGILQMEVL